MRESERVTVEVVDGVADVRLNRPDKLNALDPAMFDALVAAGDRLAADRTVRAVVLSGQGRGFCAGLDVATFQAVAASGRDEGGHHGGDGAGGAPGAPARQGSIGDPGPARQGSIGDPGPARPSSIGDPGPARPGPPAVIERMPGRITNRFQEAAHTWATMPAPVIAAIHGVALGGGLQIALAADIRVVAPDARLSVLEIRWGLVPDMTGTYMLSRLVAPDVAKELTWTGRMVSGEEAVLVGLATRTSDEPKEHAFELARELAVRNPHAIRAGKRLLDQAAEVGRREQFLTESREMAQLIGSPNQVEAISAYLEGRPPLFADPE
jgi:enoyl-CoA hydratase/carnithine racemase